MEDNNLEKNEEIKPKNEKEKICEDNNINNIEIIKEKNLNILLSNNKLNENYSMENGCIIHERKTVENNYLIKDLQDVNNLKSIDKKCCKNCIIF